MLVLCMFIEESLGDNNVKNIQNHRNGEHIKGYQWGGGEGRMGEKVQGIRSINGRYKIDRVRLRVV